MHAALGSGTCPMPFLGSVLDAPADSPRFWFCKSCGVPLLKLVGGGTERPRFLRHTVPGGMPCSGGLAFKDFLTWQADRRAKQARKMAQKQAGWATFAACLGAREVEEAGQ